MKNYSYLILFAAITLGCSVESLDSIENHETADAKAKKGQEQEVVASEYTGPGNAEFRKTNGNNPLKGYISVWNDCDNLYLEIIPAADEPEGVHLGLFQGDAFPKENGTESSLTEYEQVSFSFPLSDFDTSQELRIFSKAWGVFAGTEAWGKANYFTYTFEAVECVEVCTYGMGFWKNHGKFRPGNQEYRWPELNSNDLKLGNITYTEEDWNTIFYTSNMGNKAITLAHHLMTAKLNVANGAGNDEIIAIINEADEIIGDLKLPEGSSDKKWTYDTSIKDELEKFNERYPCKDDKDDE